MCVIIILEKGQTIPLKEWTNAVHNNEDGFGMIAKNGKDVKFFRELIVMEKDKEDDEIKRLHDIVNNHIDYYRVVHLRNATVGEVSVKNLQPFEMEFEGRKIYFFHNGTFTNYKTHGPQAEQTDSDTKRYTDEFLKPFLSIVNTEKGVADFNNPMVIKVLSDKWNTNGGTSNKGVLISDDDQLSPLLFGLPWIEKTFSNQETLKVSNNSYFESVTRGSFFLRRKQEEDRKERERKEAEDVNIVSKNNIIIFNGQGKFKRLKDVRINEEIQPITVDIGDLFQELDIKQCVETDDDVLNLLALSPEEMFYFIDQYPEKAAMLVEHILYKYADLVDSAYENKKTLVTDNKRIESHVG